MRVRIAAVLMMALVMNPTAAVRAQSAFGERVDITAIELMVEVRDAQGRVPTGLSTADFVVLEDGRPQKIIALDYVNELRQSPAERAAGAPPVAPPWQTLIYFDTGLSTPVGVYDAADRLSAQADQLVALGPVEIVVNRESPRPILSPTRDAAAVRAALASVRNLKVRLMTDVDLVRRSRAGDIAGPPPPAGAQRAGQPPPADAEISERSQKQSALISAEGEARVLRRHRDQLLGYLTRYDERSPKVLMLVSGAFGTDPSRYYVPSDGSPELKRQIEHDLRGLDLTSSFDKAFEDVAARHWTVVPIATDYMTRVSHLDDNLTTGYRDHTANGPGISVEDPLGVFTKAAKVSGGRVALQPASIVQTVSSLGERIRLTYQIARAQDEKLHSIAVRSLRAGLIVTSGVRQRMGSSSELSAARARALFLGNTEHGELGVRCAVSLFRNSGFLHREATLRVLTESAAFGELRSRLANTRLRYSIVIENSTGEPTIRQDVLPAVDFATKKGFLYDLPLRFNEDNDKVAVVVEELSTGMWGSCLQSVDRLSHLASKR